MSTTTTRARRATRTGAAIAAGGAAAAAVAVLAAPAASAVEPFSASVSPGISFGRTPYGTSCTYKVSATANWWGTAHFNVRAPDGTWHHIGDVHGVDRNQVATVDWTPSQGPGVYMIVADGAGYGSAATWPLVGTGVNLGSACLVF